MCCAPEPDYTSADLAPYHQNHPTTTDTSNTAGRRQYIDSAHFHIIRGWYVSGVTFIEVYQNKEIKLDEWREYYENGHLKETGFMISASHHCVGKWSYYAPDGKLDSIVDYDSKQPFSYFDAEAIARANGFEMPDMEVEKRYEDQKMYWEISRWREMESGGGRVAETILIDSETGSVTKP